MKTKFLLLTTIALFATISTFGQELQIRNNSRYYIDGVRISRAEALELAAPYPDVTRFIKAGVTRKYVAIGLGIVGPIAGYTGLMGVIYSSFGNSRSATIGWATLVGLGGGMMCTAVGLAIGSSSAQRKAMQLYNDYTRYDDPGALPEREGAYLSLGPTVGGLGLQLTF